MESKSMPVSSIYLRRMKDLYKFYVILGKLGTGTFGIVYKAEDIRTKDIRALKIGNKMADAYKNKFYQEIKILGTVNHKNIIQLYKVYESNHKICLVIEYCARDLYKIFTERKKLLEEDVKVIMKYLSSSVAYLHNKGIVHRDLKLENILLGTNPDNPADPWFVKLSDFGLSAVRKGTGFDSMFNSFCGTLHYIAPELVTKSYSQKCDIWSMGVIMFLLLEGRFPFKIKDIEHAVETIRDTHIDLNNLNSSKEAVDLIGMCLKKNPALRISAGEILLHPFITASQSMESSLKKGNVIEMMDEYNSRRNTENMADSIQGNVRPDQPAPDNLAFSCTPVEIIGPAKSLLPSSDEDTPKILVTGALKKKT